MHQALDILESLNNYVIEVLNIRKEKHYEPTYAKAIFKRGLCLKSATLLNRKEWPNKKVDNEA
tara:strand:- start:142 stop:330 length:189 start_codon:yes stop_codon:yes gene_type:complete